MEWHLFKYTLLLKLSLLRTVLTAESCLVAVLLKNTAGKPSKTESKKTGEKFGFCQISVLAGTPTIGYNLSSGTMKYAGFHYKQVPF